MTLFKILLKLFLFSFPLLICFGYVEYNLRTKHLISSYATKKYYVEQQLDSIETLVLGSSQTFNGIDVGCFNSKAFNLANVSQTLYYDKRIALQYLPHLPKLKTVIIGISYFSFFYQMNDIAEKWRCSFYATHFNVNEKNSKPNLLYLATYQPQHSLSLAFNHFIDDGAKTILPNGYQPKYIEEAMNDSLGWERVKIHDEEFFLNRRKEIETDLDNFVHSLTQKNIKIIFVTTPVFTSYSKYCNANIVATNTNYINTLCSKYNCTYLNFFTDERFVKNDFKNCDHLKDNGAKKLSNIINDSIKKL